MRSTDSSVQTFFFADLAGFTALTEVHGDEAAADIAAGFCESVRELLPEREAEVVKTIGDAVLVRAEDPIAAVRHALRIAHDIGVQHGSPIVRVGMHTGPAVERSGDWFGAAVNLAARVAGAAAGDEVLLTAATRDAAGEVEGVELESRGQMRLRNVREPVRLFSALRRGAVREQLTIDPVCRMAVSPERAAGHLVHEGSSFYFCSIDCVLAFATDPEHYLDDDR